VNPFKLLLGTDWGELDYLVVDLPPGTGDIHLTVSQLASLAGSVIVTTPSMLSHVDVLKGVKMYEALKVRDRGAPLLVTLLDRRRLRGSKRNLVRTLRGSPFSFRSPQVACVHRVRDDCLFRLPHYGTSRCLRLLWWRTWLT
jgi:MinD-like ATPase involved in chromosome partitioning or flagellar assembly